MTSCRRCTRLGHYRCYCSRRTSAKVLNHLRSVAVQGGKAGGMKRRQAMLAKWAQQALGMTPGEIAKAFYRKGYNNGSMVARRRAYAEGYEAALQDLRRGA